MAFVFVVILHWRSGEHWRATSHDSSEDMCAHAHTHNPTIAHSPSCSPVVQERGSLETALARNALKSQWLLQLERLVHLDMRHGQEGNQTQQ